MINVLGAIIGDVAGSLYEVKEVNALLKKEKISKEERCEILKKETPLFLENASLTDDSILSLSLIDAYLNKKDYKEKLKEYGLKEHEKGLDIYDRSKFGKGFIEFLYDDTKCNSYGNGCAMRIGALANLFNDIDTLKEEVYKATIPTHNHPDSLLCAESLAVTIYLAKNKYSKEYIKEYIEKHYFSLDFILEDLQENYKFTSKAINSVPQAIYVFLESNDFEDAIRKAISIGGDSDTIACMVGSIAENYYGIPENIIKDVSNYIPKEYNSLINKYYLTKELIDFLKEEKINQKDFLEYIKKYTHLIDTKDGLLWSGCFPKYDKNNILYSINLIMPELTNRSDLLINIHEIMHAHELFEYLGKTYKEDIQESEKKARSLEKKYLIKKLTKALRKGINNGKNSK